MSSSSVAVGQVATEGNEVSSSFQVGQSVVVRCWQEAVNASGLDDKVIAADAGMSKGYYSKIANGEQGDLLGLAYRLGSRYDQLRKDFIRRLAEAEQIDPVQLAAQQLAEASIRYLRLTAEAIPMRMVKVTSADRDAQRGAA